MTVAQSKNIFLFMIGIFIAQPDLYASEPSDQDAHITTAWSYCATIICWNTNPCPIHKTPEKKTESATQASFKPSSTPLILRHDEEMKRRLSNPKCWAPVASPR